MMNTTHPLPPGPELPLDVPHLTRLVRKAIDCALKELQTLRVPEEKRGIHILNRQGGSEWQEVHFPLYQEVSLRNIESLVAYPESKVLMDYLLDRGAMISHFSGPNPSQDDWAKSNYAEIVIHTLVSALKQTARELLVDNGYVKPWSLAIDKLEKAVEEVVSLHGNHRLSFTAVCPIIGLELPSTDHLEIALDLRLRKWTTRDLCIFSIRYKDEFLWDDFKAPGIRSNIVAEILVEIKVGAIAKPKADPVQMVKDGLDLFKWSLLLAQDRESPVSEGTCVIKAILDGRAGRFRRDDRLGDRNYTLNEKAVQRCHDLVDNYRSAVRDINKPDDLQQALWHFGRACISSLPRDALLESVMGLEALLVPGGSDSRYRFSLHGTVILQAIKSNSREHYDTLYKIYGLRSQAVHGEKAKDLDEFAPKSRKTLALMIQAIVELFLNGKLPVTKGIANAVQDYVFQKCTS